MLTETLEFPYNTRAKSTPEQIRNRPQNISDQQIQNISQHTPNLIQKFCPQTEMDNL